MNDAHRQVRAWLEFAGELGLDGFPVRLARPAAATPQPVASKPAASKPAASQPAASQPAASQPAAVRNEPQAAAGISADRTARLGPPDTAAGRPTSDAAAFERMRALLSSTPPPVAVEATAAPTAVVAEVKPLARLTMLPTALTGLVPATLADIQAEIGDDCRRCRLHERRTKIVFGVGNPRAELMFVGEGPGFDEDQQGEPFVGKAGMLLTDIIKAIGMSRDEVYIANVVKCRPPDNRTPEADEAATCGEFLRKQLFVIQPKVIVALGRPAAEALLGRVVAITKIRGQVFDYHGATLIPTFHPAYLLRNPSSKREVWEDMKLVRDRLRGER